MIKVLLTPAFLLHRRAFKNNSLLLDFFTQEHGKICLVSKGARSAKASVQPFQRLKISFAGKSELKTLTQWEVDDTPRSLRGERLILGIYANELLMRLLQDSDAHSKLFDKYQAFVSVLPNLKQVQSHWALRLFENNLLTQLGYGLDFSYDILGNKIKPNILYEYEEQMGFKVGANAKISGNLLSFLSNDGVGILPNASELKACRDLNRVRLAPLLGNKVLQSRLLFFRS
jgi:DNA repair protein RecO (recombination protein O)